MMKQNKMQNERRRETEEEIGQSNKKGMAMARGTVRCGLPPLIFCSKRSGVCGGKCGHIPDSPEDLMRFIR